MKYRNYRIRKPDPLLLLAVLVGLGVVVTTTAQADAPYTRGAKSANLHQTGARLAFHPLKGLADDLELHWLSSALDRPAVQQLVTSDHIQVGMPFGRKGPELGLSVRPDITSTAADSGDSGVGARVDDRPDLFFSLRRSW